MALVVPLDPSVGYDAHAMSSLGGFVRVLDRLPEPPLRRRSRLVRRTSVSSASSAPAVNLVAGASTLVEVVADLTQRLGAQGVVPLAAVLLDLEQSCLGEQPQVPADRRPGDRLPGGQVDDPHRPGRDGGEQVPAYGIGERSEDIHDRKVTDQLLIRKSSRS